MIVKMKKAHIAVLKEAKESLLQSLQRYGVLMLIEKEGSEISEVSEEEGLLHRTEQSLKLMKKYQEKTGLSRDEYIVDYDEFVTLDPKRQALLEKIEFIHQEIDRLKSENQTNSELLSFYLPWQDLEIPLNSLSKPKYVTIHTGIISPKYQEELLRIIYDFGGEMQVLGKAEGGQAVVFVSYYEDDREILDRIKEMGYTEISLPKEDRTVQEIIDDKNNQITRNLEMIEKLQEELKDLSKEIDELQLYNDQIASITALKKAPITFTMETVYLEGWVRNDRVEKLEKAIQEATDIYDLEIHDPQEGELPPTETKNNRFVQPFEAITNMLSIPHPYEVDPNPVMSIWYLLIFGMMMGDAGYGIFMAILFWGLIKLKKPKGAMLQLFKVLFYGSITTTLWGILFGSYFGATWNPILLEPMVDLIDYLLLTIAVGALHVITGILVQAYDNIKNKKFLDAIYDQFSWIIALVGLGMLFLPATKTIGTVFALLGAGIIVLFSKRDSKNIFSRFFGGLYSLYGISSYASDILSYTRILALSLSSAVIGMVMNLLAGMLQGSAVGFGISIIVYIIGHIFNLGMGLLSAYVHDSRLQFIEFYNKFYEGGGYPFKPLSMELKYVDAINNQVEN